MTNTQPPNGAAEREQFSAMPNQGKDNGIVLCQRAVCGSSQPQHPNTHTANGFPPPCIFSHVWPRGRHGDSGRIPTLPYLESTKQAVQVFSLSIPRHDGSVNVRPWQSLHTYRELDVQPLSESPPLGQLVLTTPTPKGTKTAWNLVSCITGVRQICGSHTSFPIIPRPPSSIPSSLLLRDAEESRASNNNRTLPYGSVRVLSCLCANFLLLEPTTPLD